MEHCNLGSFVLVDTSNGTSNAGGIRGEIVFVLQKEHTSQLKRQGHWPSKLEETRDAAKTPGVKEEGLPRRGISDELEEGSDMTDGSSDSELFQNNNRR
ncbi:hypothetical protein FRC09_013417 [Ceratobasidium sp. 395]|nr:hypothetical protein FRC09_013417 [Ceratobasidium sp. 395]